MATTVLHRPDFASMQWLMDHAKGEGMVISCYADTSVSDGVQSLWREHLDHEAQQAEQALGDDGAARHEFQRNLEVVRTALSSKHVTAELRTHIQERSGVTTGPQEVIDAIRCSQVNWPGYVVMAPDHGATGWRCAGCEAIFARDHATCPYCQARCQKVNLWQEIALLATRHGIVVHFVGEDAGLAEHGGVAARLTREDPWKPAPDVAVEGASASPKG